MYALILAGGSGTRFWPLSRNSRPKQLLDLFGTGTLLRQTIDRILPIIPAENIFILTNQLQHDEVCKIAKDIPLYQIVCEPIRRDTAPAVALGAALIAAKDPNATMVVLPSDQLIQNSANFLNVIQDAAKAAEYSSALVTIGIKPTWACPSYGYIQRAESVEIPHSSTQTYEVERFREKPDSKTAEEFLNRGNFSWNAGMFVWSISALKNQFSRHCTQLAEFIECVEKSPNPLARALQLFPNLTPISIDFALMEKADRVLNLEASFDWDDIGSWISISKYLTQNPAEEASNAANCPITTLKSNGNIVYSAQNNKHVALLNVQNLIVVDTSDALLVADRNDADSIKKLVEYLPSALL